MNGAGNAILVIDLRAADAAVTPEDARALHRAPGLAFDQLMVLTDPATPGDDAFMTIFNQDGSLSASCGNGTRCVAHVLFQKRPLAEQTGADEIRLATSAGRLAVFRDGPLSYTVDMGPPRLDWREIPLSREVADTGAVDLGRFGLPPASCVSMGNPHAIFFVPDAARFDLAEIGPALEHDPLFPERANISLAQVLSRAEVRLKVWERGTGLTLACGTAACATLVAGVRAGLLERRAHIALPGGDLIIRWRESDGHVEMTGPVELESVREIDPDWFGDQTARA
jgi:diaminopimelate epimerase